MKPQPTHICYVVKTDDFEPQFHKGQRIEAVATTDRIGYGKPVLILYRRKLYFGYLYPSNKKKHSALMDGKQQITYVKRYDHQKRYLVIDNEHK